MTDARPKYPLDFAWDGEHMTPRRPRAADRQFVVGEVYRLEVIEERSINTHNHYFASIQEAWKNMPEDLIEQYPTPEHLRKKALIKCGFRDERSIVCASKAEAQRIAAFIKPLDEYAIVIVRDSVVIHLTAKSQSYKAMDKKTFRDSKESVLNAISELIGVTPKQLESNAGKAA